MGIVKVLAVDAAGVSVSVDVDDDAQPASRRAVAMATVVNPPRVISAS
jgi:hypothetical protein